MTFVVCALALVGLLEAGATWWLIRGLRRLGQVDDRLSHLTEALRLLTETTEAGFRASAQELIRVAQRAPAAPVEAAPAPAVTAPRPRARRVAEAPRKGRTAKKAAGPEPMSESELRLRLHLAETGKARAAAAKEAGRVALRA